MALGHESVLKLKYGVMAVQLSNFTKYWRTTHVTLVDTVPCKSCVTIAVKITIYLTFL